MTRDGHLTLETLLLLVDDQLDARAAEAVRTHLAGCDECRHVRESLGRLDRELRADLPTGDWHEVTERSRLRTTVGARLAGAVPSAPRRVASQFMRPAMAAAAVLLVVIAGTFLMRPGPGDDTTPRSATSEAIETGALPIPHLTPGATVALPVSELCRRIPLEPAPIPVAVRESVLRAYGMELAPEHEYELDYLVTPDLGGAPDPRNLWPEPYGARLWNARVKDELESLLPQLVCEGKVDLATAQRDIATDWIAAYKKYFRTERPIRMYSTREFSADHQ